MEDRGAGLVGGIAAGRPLLSGAVITLAAAALVSIGYRNAPLSFVDLSVSYLAAMFFLTIAPAAIGAVAPRNFWLRTIYAGLAAGILLAARRFFVQAEISFACFDFDRAFVAFGFLSFFLAIGAPLWRSAIGLALIGLAGVEIGVSAGLAIFAIETVRQDDPLYAGPTLALSSALGAAISVQIASAYSRNFARQGDNFAAAALAARGCAAPALFSIAIGTAAAALIAGRAGGASEALTAARAASGAMAFALMAPLLLLSGGLALKAQTEMTAVLENQRRSALRPLLNALRNVLSPSVALSASAIFIIIAIIAGFEAATPPGFAETAFVAIAAAIAALVFVSLRTALLTGLLVVIVGHLAIWSVELFGLAPPTETARIVAACLVSALSLQLLLSWRDNRNPRRKSREVVRMTLSESLFSYVAASLLAVGAISASGIAGLWSEGVDASIYLGIALILAGIVSVPLMAAVGALFGRN